MRRFFASAALCAAAALASACAGGPKAMGPSGHLVVVVSPPMASLLLDEQPLSTARSDGRLRTPLYVGAYRLEVMAPGYFPIYRDVRIEAGKETLMEVKLRANPDIAPALDSATQTPTLGPRMPSDAAAPL